MNLKTHSQRMFVRERLTARRLAITLATLALLIVAVGVFRLRWEANTLGLQASFVSLPAR